MRTPQLTLVYLDFSKALDKIPHHRLLLKLQVHGIECKILKGVKTLINNRKQRLQNIGKRSVLMIPRLVEEVVSEL